MDVCVCGHPRADHRAAELSVPLVNDEPIYRNRSNSPGNNIGATHLTASYEFEQCHCGCTIYESLVA
jgi:hypothetical protein